MEENTRRGASLTSPSFPSTVLSDFRISFSANGSATTAASLMFCKKGGTAYSVLVPMTQPKRHSSRIECFITHLTLVKNGGAIELLRYTAAFLNQQLYLKDSVGEIHRPINTVFNTSERRISSAHAADCLSV